MEIEEGGGGGGRGKGGTRNPISNSRRKGILSRVYSRGVRPRYRGRFINSLEESRMLHGLHGAPSA